jgi:hypothetical protein
MFVDEAFHFIPSLENLPEFRDTFRRSKDEIYAGLNVFAGRRYIDAGRYRDALSYFGRAVRLHFPTALKYWYKIIQALGGAIGLDKVFLGYRIKRRLIQHHSQQMRVSEKGVEWVRK